MPPKKAAAPSKKTETKKKEKIIEDKTFGLKNKKGAKQQRFIQQVEKQVKHGNNPKNPKEPNALTKKEEKKKELEQLNQIFRPVASQKVEKGVDPKSVLCAFFKSGQCSKGDKCKFSHDLTIERKAEKKSLYCDTRAPEDSMENWDEEKLKEVVEKKHGEREKKLPPTDIICKHFIEAIELNKYGWFWDCPNGGDKCHYRHALPPGFVLKRDKKKDGKKDDITIEELVEIERSKLGYNLTKITLETFLAWKKKKIAEKQNLDRTERDRKKAEFRAGKNTGLSGREMFTFNPDMAIENTEIEEGGAAMDIVREDDDDDEVYANVKEIDVDLLLNDAKETDGSGTQSNDLKRNFAQTEGTSKTEPTQSEDHSKQNGQNGGGDNADDGDGDEDLIDEPIDESLFADDDLDDLDDALNAVSLG